MSASPNRVRMFNNKETGKPIRMKMPVHNTSALALKLNRAAHAYREMKKIEKALDRARKEYHRLARLVIYSHRPIIRNSSIALHENEQKRIKLMSKLIKNASVVRRTLKNLPRNMRNEVFKHIKSAHITNYQR